MGWYTQAIFDNAALMGLPFFLEDSVTDFLDNPTPNEQFTQKLSTLKISYSENFIQRNIEILSFEVIDDELTVRLNSSNMSRLTSSEDYQLSRSAAGYPRFEDTFNKQKGSTKNQQESSVLKLFKTACAHFDAEAYEDALTVLKKALESKDLDIDPTIFAKLYYLQGLIHFSDMGRKRGDWLDYNKAQIAFEAAAARSSNSKIQSEALCKAGLAACAAGQHKKAYHIFYRACEANPADSMANYLYACNNFQRGSFEQGRDYLEQAFLLDLDIFTIALMDPSSRYFIDDLQVAAEQVKKQHKSAIVAPISSAKVAWQQALKRLKKEDEYQSLFPFTEKLLRIVSKEIKDIDLAQSSLLEIALLDKRFDQNHNRLTKKLLSELGKDKTELSEDLEEFEKQRKDLKKQRSPRPRSFMKVYSNVWERSSKVTQIGLFSIQALLFALFFTSGLSVGSEQGFGIVMRTIGAFCIAVLFLLFTSIAVIPAWYIFRIFYIFIKSLLVGLFVFLKDSRKKELFDEKKMQQIAEITSNIKNTEADLDDAKRLRHDLIEILERR